MHDLRHWLGNIVDRMQSEDVVVVTIFSGLILGTRTIRNQSDFVSPSHHINILNPASLSQLAVNAGLERLHVFTPVVLDLDILRNNCAKGTNRFWTSVLHTSDDV